MGYLAPDLPQVWFQIIHDIPLTDILVCDLQLGTLMVDQEGKFGLQLSELDVSITSFSISVSGSSS
jgi:hypothetical protein